MVVELVADVVVDVELVAEDVVEAFSLLTVVAEVVVVVVVVVSLEDAEYEKEEV